jgi:putative oxidoreductase
VIEDLASLVLRLVVGAIFVAQGHRKLFGDPEAHHGRANLTRMLEQRRIMRAPQVALLISVTELLFGSLLVVGLMTRLAVIPLVALLLGAILLFKIREGFIGGWDWPLSVLASSTVILLLGAGGLSLDALLGIGI